MHKSNLIISNAAIIWVTQILLIVPQLIFVPYLIGTVGEKGYGIYALVWSLMTSIDQIEKSLQSGVVKYSAGYLAQGRLGDFSKVVSSSIAYSLGVAIFTFLAILIAALQIHEVGDPFKRSLIVVAVMSLLIIPLTPYIATIQSRQIYYVSAVAETIGKYIGLLLVIVIFQMLTPIVEVVVIVMTGALLLSRVSQSFIAKQYSPGFVTQFRLVEWSTFRTIAAFGGGTVLASLCLAVNSTGIRWIMSALVSVEFVTQFVVMVMPSLLLSQIVGAMTVTVMPATSRYLALGNRAAIAENLLRGLRYTTILVLTSILVAAYMIEDLISLWVGQQYVFLAPFAFLLFLGSAIRQSTSVAHHILKGYGELRVIIAVYFVGLVLIPIGLIVVFLKLNQNPYIATVVGLGAGNVCVAVAQLVYSAKVSGVRLLTIVTYGYLQPLSLAVLSGMGVWGVTSICQVESEFANMWSAAISSFVFLAGCYRFIASDTERIAIGGLCRSIVTWIGRVKVK